MGMALVLWNGYGQERLVREVKYGEERSAAMEGRRSMYDCILYLKEGEEDKDITR